MRNIKVYKTGEERGRGGYRGQVFFHTVYKKDIFRGGWFPK